MASSKSMSKLSHAEAERLDSLLAAAARFHQYSIISTGLLILLSVLDHEHSLGLPWTNIELPRLQSFISVYLLVIGLAMFADRFYAMALPWMDLDPRRPPFAWVALGTIQSNDTRGVTRWLLAPVIVSGLVAGFALESLTSAGVILAWNGWWVFLLPRVLRRYFSLIQRRLDHRGGSITFSIYLLYWYRMARQVLLTAIWMTTPVRLIPAWRAALPANWWIGPLLTFFGIYLITGLCSIPLVYRKIDALGKHFGFATTSPHYQ